MKATIIAITISSHEGNVCIEVDGAMKYGDIEVKIEFIEKDNNHFNIGLSNGNIFRVNGRFVISEMLTDIVMEDKG